MVVISWPFATPLPPWPGSPVGRTRAPAFTPACQFSGSLRSLSLEAPSAPHLVWSQLWVPATQTLCQSLLTKLQESWRPAPCAFTWLPLCQCSLSTLSSVRSLWNPCPTLQVLLRPEPTPVPMSGIASLSGKPQPWPFCCCSCIEPVFAAWVPDAPQLSISSFF